MAATYDQLIAAGYKITEPRKRVLAALEEAHGPCTAQEVAEHANTSVASTYRVLGLLVGLGVVSEVPDSGGEHGCAAGGCRRYSLCSAQGHHHHFVCRSCHATLDIASDALERALADIEAHTGLRVEAHDVTLRGQCPRCQSEQTETPSNPSNPSNPSASEGASL